MTGTISAMPRIAKAPAASRSAACSVRWKASASTWPRTRAPAVRPAIQTARNPLAPMLSATANAATAMATRAMPWYRRAAYRRSAAARRSQPPPRPATRPTTVDATSTNTSVDSALASGWPPAAISATARRIVTNGSARPSLSPLSTLSAFRTTAGTRGFATTAWPSAASVGERITPMRPACQTARPGSTMSATRAPTIIVNGSPTPRRRPDRAGSRVQRWTSSADESANRTITSAASSSRTSRSSPGSTWNRPRSGPVARPSVAKKIGIVTIVDAIRRDTSAQPRTASAKTVSGAITAASHLPRRGVADARPTSRPLAPEDKHTDDRDPRRQDEHDPVPQRHDQHEHESQGIPDEHEPARERPAPEPDRAERDQEHGRRARRDRECEGVGQRANEVDLGRARRPQVQVPD